MTSRYFEWKPLKRFALRSSSRSCCEAEGVTDLKEATIADHQVVLNLYTRSGCDSDEPL